LLSTRGIALGVIPDIQLHEHETTLHPGDLLAAYTDGATEALRSDNAEFGVVGLQSTITTLRKKPAQTIVEETIRALDRFVDGEPQFDDITLVVVKHNTGTQSG